MCASSLCVLPKAIRTASEGTRREDFFLCRIVSGQARQGAPLPCLQVDNASNRGGEKEMLKMIEQSESLVCNGNTATPSLSSTQQENIPQGQSRNISPKETSDSVLRYCKDQLDVIRQINARTEFQTPVGFVAIATFMGYLSRLAYGENKAHENDKVIYIRFVNNILSQVFSGYQAISTQMYSTFRCGIVHAMSFTPALDASEENASIAISHDNETKRTDTSFCVETRGGVAYTVLNASDLANDIEKAIDIIFSNDALAEHALTFVKIQPPIRTV